LIRTMIVEKFEKIKRTKRRTTKYRVKFACKKRVQIWCGKDQERELREPRF